MKNKNDVLNFLLFGYNSIEINQETKEIVSRLEADMRSLGINQDIIDEAVEKKRETAAQGTMNEVSESTPVVSKSDNKNNSAGFVRFVPNKTDIQKKSTSLMKIVQLVDEEEEMKNKKRNEEEEETEIALVEGTELSKDDIDALVRKAKSNPEEQEILEVDKPSGSADKLAELFAGGVNEIRKKFKSIPDFAKHLKSLGIKIHNATTWSAAWAEFEKKMQDESVEAE